MKGLSQNNNASRLVNAMDFRKLMTFDLSNNSKLLFLFLCTCCNDENKYYCYPSQQYISKNSGMALRTVQNCLRELESKGFIQTQRNPIGTLTYFIIEEALYKSIMGEDCPNEPGLPEAIAPEHNFEELVFRLAVPRPMQKMRPKPAIVTKKRHQPAEKAVEVKHNKHTGTVNFADNIRNKNLNTIPPLPPKQADTKVLHKGCVSLPSFSPTKKSRTAEALEAFNHVWGIWPRKEAKERAQKMWLIHWKNKTLPPLPELTAKIRAFIPTRETRFIPYLGNWLFDRRWQDEQCAPQVHTSIQQQRSTLHIQQELDEHEKLKKFWRERTRVETEQILKRNSCKPLTSS